MKSFIQLLCAALLSAAALPASAVKLSLVPLPFSVMTLFNGLTRLYTSRKAPALTTRLLAGLPGVGHVRPDLTRRQMLFWTSGPYHIIYHPETLPLEIERIIHAARDVKKHL